MSSEQATLADAFGEPAAARESEQRGAAQRSQDGQATQTAAWTPSADSSDGKRCQACGSHVTDDFARVYGDNDDIAHACPRCAPSFAALRDGAAANPDHDWRVDT